MNWANNLESIQLCCKSRAAVRGKLLDRSHVLIDIDDTAGDYTCRVEAPLDLDAVPVE